MERGRNRNRPTKQLSHFARYIYPSVQVTIEVSSTVLHTNIGMYIVMLNGNTITQIQH